MQQVFFFNSHKESQIPDEMTCSVVSWRSRHLLSLNTQTVYGNIEFSVEFLDQLLLLISPGKVMKLTDPRMSILKMEREKYFID